MRQDVEVFLFQWLSMLYHSALSLMLVDIAARTITQIMTLIIIYILNAIFNAILFGIYFELITTAK